MWAKLVVSVTLLPMLIHSMAGCCWHHSHSRTDLFCEHANVAPRAEHRDDVGHMDADVQCSKHTEPVSPSPCEKDSPCDDVCCVYLAAEPERSELTFELYEQFTAFDVSGIMVLGLTAPTPKNPHQTHQVSGALQHCALTQVWVV